MRMTHLTVLSGALCIALCSGVTGARAAEPDADLIEKGRKIAEENCMRCHAIDETSTSTHKSAPEFRNVFKQYSPWTLAEALAEGIVTGHPDMPEFKFEPPEISALLSYMDTLTEDTSDEKE